MKFTKAQLMEIILRQQESIKHPGGAFVAD